MYVNLHKVSKQYFSQRFQIPQMKNVDIDQNYKDLKDGPSRAILKGVPFLSCARALKHV